MAVALVEQLFTIERILTGGDSFVVNTPHRLKITAGDTEIMNEKVPNNKQWRVYLTVRIEETKE